MADEERFVDTALRLATTASLGYLSTKAHYADIVIGLYAAGDGGIKVMNDMLLIASRFTRRCEEPPGHGQPWPALPVRPYGLALVS